MRETSHKFTVLKKIRGGNGPLGPPSTLVHRLPRSSRSPHFPSLVPPLLLGLTLPWSTLCTAAPYPQKKSEKGPPLLRFFLRGGGGCTQANPGALVWRRDNLLHFIALLLTFTWPVWHYIYGTYLGTQLHLFHIMKQEREPRMFLWLIIFRFIWTNSAKNDINKTILILLIGFVASEIFLWDHFSGIS